MEMKEKLRKYLLNISYFNKGDAGKLTDDFLLMENDIITSIEVINLVEFIEENFQFQITVSDVKEENFGSINKLISFIKKRIEK